MSFEQLRRRFLRVTGQDWRSAVLGDANGIIYEPGRLGYVRVRYPVSPGEYSAPVLARMRTNTPVEPGLAVKVGYDDDGVLAVVSIDFAAQVEQGRNPLLANAADARLHGYTSQSRIVTLLSGAVSTPETDSTDVWVLSYFWVDTDGVAHLFPGERVSLAAYIPAAGLHCLAGLFLNTSTESIEISASTPKAIADPLTIEEDVQECVDGATSGALPVWFWRLADAQTRITDADSFLDARQMINATVGSAASVPPSRTLTAGDGLSGGGDLSADRTFALDVNDLTAESNADDADYIAIYDTSASATRKQTRADFLAGAVGGSAGVLSCGRLTLQSGNALPSLDVTGATTLYWTPYRGNRISFYDGSTWQDAAYAEASVAIPATTNTNYDVYLYDNAGSIAFDLVAWRNSGQAITNATNATPIVITANAHGLSNGDTVYIQGVRGNTAANGTWVVANVTTNTFELVGSSGNGAYTSGTGYFNARSTLPTLQDGIWVQTGATGRRLWGAIRTTGSSGQCEDSLLHRFCTNLWNREMRPFYKNDATGHTYTSTTYRWWNNSTTHYIDFVQALDAAVYGSIACTGYAGAAGQSMTVGISMDKGTLIESQFGWGMNFNTQYTAGGGSGAVTMMAGYHFLAVTEAGGPAGSYFNQYQLKGFVLG